MFLNKDHLCCLSYVVMSDHEHSDGELEEVPSATVATPSLSIGKEAGIRKDPPKGGSKVKIHQKVDLRIRPLGNYKTV